MSLNTDLDSIDATVHALSLEVDRLNAGLTTSNQLVLSKATVAAGNPIYGQLNGVQRWLVEVGDGQAESGGNNGSHFSVSRYSDAGTYIDTPIFISRTTGAVFLSGALSCHFGSSWNWNISPSTTSDNAVVQFLDSSGAALGYVGWLRSQSAIYLTYNGGGQVAVFAGGVQLNGATAVNGAVTISGVMTINNGATVNGGLNVGGITSSGDINAPGKTLGGAFVHSTGNINADTNVNAGGGVYGGVVEANQGSIRIKRGSSNNALVLLSNNATDLGSINYDMSAGKMMMSHLPTGAALILDGSSAFTFNGSGTAYKAGGGSWTATSDARVKEVAHDYDAGLEEVLRLQPVVYRYKGNDSYVEDASSPHKEAAEAGTPFVGLVAQEAELVMPELVSMREGYIDGEKVADLRTIDQTPLIFALINAVKELKAEIEELKKR